MGFRDFSFPGVRDALGLTLAEANLFGAVPALPLTPEFTARLGAGADWAIAVNTEKARSEFIVAPLLIELKLRLLGGFGLHSGVQFDVDSSRGLNGVCDFLLTRSTMQSFVEAPIVAIVEAKNDAIRTGFGQCIATTVAAREFSTKSPTPVETLHGVVTTGTAWVFLRLTGSAVTLDTHEYSIAEPGRILGILAHILTAPATASSPPS